MVSTVWTIVPIKDEEENVAQFAESLLAAEAALLPSHKLHVLVVDDGSADRGGELVLERLSASRATVLRHDACRGPGAAFHTAFAHLSGRITEKDWVLTVEGDNTSRLELVRQMLRRSEEGYDVILASPYMYGGGITNTALHRSLMSHVANAFVKELLGIRGILTMSSFFRLYRGSVISRLQALYGPGIIERQGFECMLELLLKLTALGTTISEVPMVLDSSRRKGRSKMKIARTVLGYLSLWRPTRRWRAIAVQSQAD